MGARRAFVARPPNAAEGGERRWLSSLPTTSTAGAFVSNAASQAHTRVGFAKNATNGAVSAVTRCFAHVHAVASRFSQHVATLSIAHGLAECSHAMLLSLRRKVCDGSVPSRGRWCDKMGRRLLRCGSSRSQINYDRKGIPET
jgi:hypothetical protein